MPGLKVGAKAGVVSAVEVQSPLASAQSAPRLMSTESAATWAFILFISSIIVLYFVL